MANVVVLANGSPLVGWKEVHVTQAFDKVTGHGEVKMSEQPGRPLPMKYGDLAVVLIDGRPVITGHVHRIHGDFEERRHDITVEIYDKTKDFVDSSVGPKLKLKSPIMVPQIVQRTVGVMGLPIGVITGAPSEPIQQGEQVSASIDERGFSFCDKWCQKRQLLMTTDGRGNIVVTRNMGLPGAGMLYSNFEDDAKNNVKRSHYCVEDLDRHHKNKIIGQKSTNDQDWWESKDKGEPTGQADPMQEVPGEATDSTVRPERQLWERGAQGLAGTSPQKAAQWRANTAKAKGLKYTATVQGFYGSPGATGGWLWWPGFIIPVFDPHWQLEAALLIRDVKFSKSWGGGETTEITCTYPDAFTTDQGGAAAATSRTANLGLGTPDPGTYAGGG